MSLTDSTALDEEDITASDEIEFNKKNGALEEKLFIVAYNLRRHSMFADRAETIRYALWVMAFDFLQLLPFVLTLYGTTWGPTTANVVALVKFFDCTTFMKNKFQDIKIVVALSVLSLLILSVMLVSSRIVKTHKSSKGPNSKVKRYELIQITQNFKGYPFLLVDGQVD
jgi:hypothetical protein